MHPLFTQIRLLLHCHGLRAAAAFLLHPSRQKSHTPTQPPATCHLPPLRPTRRAGFSLLELLVVIAMMIFITTITVMNYFGAMRTGGWNTVSNNVFSALIMARQRACLDSKPVYFYLLNATNYVVQTSAGTITRIDGAPRPPLPGAPAGIQKYWDQYGSLASVETNSRIVNMDRPLSYATVWRTYIASMTTSNVTDNGSMDEYTVPALQLYLVPDGIWAEGDHYGTHVFTPQMLPNGFIFDPDPSRSSAPANERLVAFNPDGTINTDPTTGGLSELVVKEIISGKTKTFTIWPSGKITQGP